MSTSQLPFVVFSLSYTINIGLVSYSGATLPAHGDVDANGLIILADFKQFTECRTAPEGAADVYCLMFDFDKDQDVDLIDFAALQADFDG